MISLYYLLIHSFTHACTRVYIYIHIYNIDKAVILVSLF